VKLRATLSCGVAVAAAALAESAAIVTLPKLTLNPLRLCEKKLFTLEAQREDERRWRVELWF
jgi:hypothetical protein